MYYQTITPAEMKRIETAAMEAGACTGEALMGRAAAAVARAVERHCHGWNDTVVAVCGTGNNGGDAMAALRMLHAGHPLLHSFCLLLEGELTPDARRERERLAQCPGAVILPVGEEYTQAEWFRQDGLLVDPALEGARSIACVIDGLFGTGLSRPVTGTAAELIRCCNRQQCPVVAVDIPSGLCGRTGQVQGIAVHAAATVTFHRPKPGLFLGQGLAYTGRVTVASIGLPEEYDDAEGALLWEKDEVLGALPKYHPTDHKGDHGRVVLLCGSPGMAGAAALAATAALRTGAGLVTVACPERILDTVQQLCPCATCLPLSPDADAAWAALEPLLEEADALAMGCGLGRSQWAAQLVKKVLERLSEEPVSTVIDADALNLLAKLDISGLDLTRCVLTPHPGEAARLLGTNAGEITADAMESARQIRQRYGVCGVVLKGAATVIDTRQGTALNLIGTPAMGKGGSGDVLTGVLCALLGLRNRRFFATEIELDRPAPLLTLLQTGCGLHGSAGCAARKEYGTRGVLATDLCRYLGMEQQEEPAAFPPLLPAGSPTFQPPVGFPPFQPTERLLDRDEGQPVGWASHWYEQAAKEAWHTDRPHGRPRHRFGGAGFTAAGSKKGWLKGGFRSLFGKRKRKSTGGWSPAGEAYRPWSPWQGTPWRGDRGPFGQGGETGRSETAGEAYRPWSPWQETPWRGDRGPFGQEQESLRRALLRRVTVTVEHTPGEIHPEDRSLVYTLNHGYVQEELGNRWQDAYVYGETGPLEVFEGIVVATLRRENGCTVWVVASEPVPLTEEQVRAAVASMEKERILEVECI